MAIGAYTITKSAIIMMRDGKTFTVDGTHPNYVKIRENLRIKDLEAAEKLIDIVTTIKNYTKGKVVIENGILTYNGEEIKSALVDHILRMMNEGFDVNPMVLFLENLLMNPSKTAVDELYLFLEKAELPITEDGHFLAYKKVDTNYLDFYTHTFDNSVGKIIEMPRNKVDDNRNRTCSHGLHFCSLTYLPHYHGGSGKVMIVKINPADVVSIPSDYDNSKGRTWRYEVIGEHHDETVSAFDKSVYVTDDSDDLEFSDEELEIHVAIKPKKVLSAAQRGALDGANGKRAGTYAPRSKEAAYIKSYKKSYYSKN